MAPCSSYLVSGRYVAPSPPLGCPVNMQLHGWCLVALIWFPVPHTSRSPRTDEFIHIPHARPSVRPSVPFRSVPFRSVPFRSAPFCPVLPCPIMSCPVPSRSVPFRFVPFRSVSPRLVSRLISSHLISSQFISSRLISSHLISCRAGEYAVSWVVTRSLYPGSA